METSTKWLIGGGVTLGLGLLYLHFKPKTALKPVVNTATLAKGADPNADKNINKVPPDPTLAAQQGGASVPVYAPAWYKPTDDLSPSGIGNATKMTVRQVQAALKAIGAYIPITGAWDLPTIQALWDFQNDPSGTSGIRYTGNPLNVTGEMDQLTQTALQGTYGAKMNVQTGFY